MAVAAKSSVNELQKRVKITFQTDFKVSWDQLYSMYSSYKFL